MCNFVYVCAVYVPVCGLSSLLSLLSEATRDMPRGATTLYAKGRKGVAWKKTMLNLKLLFDAVEV